MDWSGAVAVAMEGDSGPGMMGPRGAPESLIPFAL